MNKLFGFTFLATFLTLSTNDYWGYAFIGVIALLFIAPYTTPETMGQKKR